MSNWQGVIQGYKEHNEMLMKMVKERGDESTRLREENARLREALEFYADPENYEEWEDSNPETEYMFNVHIDEGNTARRALENADEQP